VGKVRNCYAVVCDIFDNLPMLNIRFGAGAVGPRAGAASRCDSSSTKTMRLLAAPAPQHCLKERLDLSNTVDMKSCYVFEMLACDFFLLNF
jgi:hypothetical protein